MLTFSTVNNEYIVDTNVRIDGNDVIATWDMDDWHVPNMSLYEINAKWTVEVTFHDQAELYQKTKRLSTIDDNFTASLYVTELDENPYYSDEEWEMWLFENIFETNDWEVLPK